MYRVLTPVYTEAGRTVVQQIDGTTRTVPIYSVSWRTIGQAESMEEAKQITPCPVLEEV